MSVEPRFLTVQEIAEFSRVTPATVYRWIAEGKVPSIRIGHAVRIPSRWRAAILAAAEGESSAEAANS